MKHVLSAIAVYFFLTNAAAIEEVTSQPVKAESATEDCSKQVWPNFSVVPPPRGSSNQCPFGDSKSSLTRNNCYQISLAFANEPSLHIARAILPVYDLFG
jgi:hypothetical protein